MSKYEYKATNLIAETFTARDIKFDVVNRSGCEHLLAGFPIQSGPLVIARFICDEDNDVQVRIYGLVSQIPEEKRPRMLEACNILNAKVRYLKFYLDPDGDLCCDYDIPSHTPDEALGEIAAETFVRLLIILESEYIIFTKALFTEEDLDSYAGPNSHTLLQMLLDLARNHAAEGDEDEDDVEFEFDPATDSIDLSDEYTTNSDPLSPIIE